jgi:hypothetical protein
MVIILAELCPVLFTNILPETLNASWQRCQHALELMGSHNATAQKYRETLNAIRQKAAPSISSKRSRVLPLVNRIDMIQMSQKASHRRPNLLHPRWKHIQLFRRKVEEAATNRSRLEAVPEARTRGIFILIFSLMVHSCGTCYGKIQGQSLLGILRSGECSMIA